MAHNACSQPVKRVAVIGGGIAGIGCLWGLRDTDCDVHLYEADSRLGGHANTVTLENHGQSVSVDTGFIAMNNETYRKYVCFCPSFVSLL